MNINLHVIYYFCLFFLTSCPEEISMVEIRVFNGTSSDMQKVELRNIEIGELKSKNFSKYIPFDSGYAYDKISCVMDEKVYEVSPADFVGEEPLKAGKYTYKLTLQDEILNIELNRN